MSTSKKSIDEQEQERLFTPQKFTLDQFHQLIHASHKRRHPKGGESYGEGEFNGFHHNSPFSMQIHCMFMMLQHIMWKLSDNLHDIEQISFIESGWDRAIDEVEANFWRLGHSDQVEAKIDAWIEAVDRKSEEKRREKKVRTIRQTLEVEE